MPVSKLARILLAHSLQGVNWPGSKKALYPLHAKNDTGEREAFLKIWSQLMAEFLLRPVSVS